jgi:hypothetical protein
MGGVGWVEHIGGEMGPRLRFLVVVATIAAVVVATTVAIAQVSGVTKAKGGSISKVRIKRGENATSTSSTNYVNIPGAKVKVKVPHGHQALFLMRFSAESACSDSATTPDYCSVRILVDGQQAKPATGFDFAFDSTDNGTESFASWESHSMDRSLVVGGGRHKVKAQYGTTSSTTSFRVDDWSLTVESSKK